MSNVTAWLRAEAHERRVGDKPTKDDRILADWLEQSADEIERLRSEVRAMTEISINLLHASGILATGLDLVQIRALAEALDGEETRPIGRGVTSTPERKQ